MFRAACCWLALLLSSTLSLHGVEWRHLIPRAGNESIAALKEHISAFPQSVNEPDQRGLMPLFVAVEREHEQAVAYLLAARAAVDHRRRHGRRALELAARRGNHRIVEMLLAADASVDPEDENVASALELAAEYGHFEAVEILVGAGANPLRRRQPGARKNTLVHSGFAYFLKSEELLQHERGMKLLQRMLRRIENPQVFWANEPYLVLAALRRGPKVFSLFLPFIDVHKPLQGADGYFLLHEVIRQSITREFRHGQRQPNDPRIELIDLLVQAGAHIDVRSKKDQVSPLLLAIDQGRGLMLIQHLFHLGADAQTVDRNGNGAIHYICKHGRASELLIHLLQKGAHADVQAKDGSTALHLLANARNEPSLLMAEVLYRRGIDLRHTNNKGDSVMAIAQRQGHWVFVDWLEGIGINQSEGLGAAELFPILFAQRRMDHLYKLLASPGLQQEAKDSLLMAIAEQGSAEDKALLLKVLRLGADFSVENAFGEHPTSLLVSRDQIELLEAWVSAGFTLRFDLGPHHNMLNEVVQRRVDLLHDIREETARGHIDPKDLADIEMAAERSLRLVQLLLRSGANPLREPSPALFTAVQGGDKAVVQLFVEGGLPITTTNERGENLLMLASRAQGGAELLTWLINNGLRPQANDLLKAAHAGDVDGLRLLIEVGLPVNYQGPEGETALTICAELGHVQAATYLLEQGANPNCGRHHGGVFIAEPTHQHQVGEVKPLHMTTALYSSIERRSVAIALRLIEHGANPNITPRNGSAPLHLAAKMPSLRLVQALLKAGADPAQRSHEPNYQAQRATNNTALHMAVQLNTGQPEIIRALVEGGAPIDAKDSLGRSALEIALRQGHDKRAQLLKELGASTEGMNVDEIAVLRAWRSQDIQGIRQAIIQHPKGIHAQLFPASASLHHGVVDTLHAFQHGQMLPGGREAWRALIPWFMEMGLPLDARNASDCTPLMLSMNHGDIETARLLLELGADPNAIADLEGVAPKSVLLHAIGMGHFGGSVPKEHREKFVDLLLQYDVNPRLAVGKRTPLGQAMAYDLSIAFKLVEAGALDGVDLSQGPNLLRDINWRDPRALALAELLVAAGASVNGDAERKHLPIIRAAGFDKAVLKKLVELGADPTLVNSHGTSALHVAAKRGLTENVLFLLKAGVAVDVPNQHGETALTLAELSLARTQVEGYGEEERLLETIQSLHDAGAKTSSLSREQWKLYYIILDGRRAGLAEQIIRKNPEIITSWPKSADSLLVLAAGGESFSLFSLLLEFGLDPVTAVFDGKTALIYAASGGQEKMVEELIRRKVLLNVRSDSGRTALDYAEGKCIELLREAGALRAADLRDETTD